VRDRLYNYRVVSGSIRVIDGDSLELSVDVGFSMQANRLRIRLLGIDCPERREEGWNEAGDFTREWIGDGEGVMVKTHRQDGFGRWLGDVFREDEDGRAVDLGRALMDAGHAMVWRRA
jgi:micrococcal nuclease